MNRDLLKPNYVIDGRHGEDELLPAIPTDEEMKIINLIESSGHIWHYSMKDGSEDGLNMSLRDRKRVARTLVESGYLWRQDPIEFDITRAGAVALAYIRQSAVA